MKVRELLKKLEGVNEEANVIIEDDYGEEFHLVGVDSRNSSQHDFILRLHISDEEEEEENEIEDEEDGE